MAADGLLAGINHHPPGLRAKRLVFKTQANSAFRAGSRELVHFSIQLAEFHSPGHFWKPGFAAAALLAGVDLLWSQRGFAGKVWDPAWASARVSVYKTQKRYAFEKTSRWAAGRAEKR